MKTQQVILLGLFGLTQVVLAEGGGSQKSHSEKGNSAGGSSHGSGGESKEPVEDPEEVNVDFAWYLGFVWVALIASITAFYLTIRSIEYVRQIACLNNDTQRYFLTPNLSYARLKKYFIDAPLLKTRHHREFRLSTAINVGTLPSRMQTLFLLGYVAMNIVFSVYKIDFSLAKGEVLDLLRNRTGVLAVMNMLPLFLLASRNNPFISICGISFDTFNLIHRWIGRVVVLQALAHTLAFMLSMVPEMSFGAFWEIVVGEEFLLSGMIGTIAFLVLLLQSPSIVRHAFYEAFLHTHIVGAAVAVAGVYIHVKDMHWIKVIHAVIGLWAVERFTRVCMLIYRNIGRGGTKAVVEALPGEAVRVTLRMARPWNFRPGQHVYLYMPSIGLWTNHPFSLVWSEEEEELSSEKGIAMNRQDILEMRKTSMSLIIRRRTGFTDRLWKKAEKAPEGRMTVRCAVEGPYGGESLQSFGTVLLFAAGVGVTHQVPHVRDLVAGYANGSVATRKIVLVWIIQSPEHLEWIRPWMTSILAMPKRRDVLKIMLFVTRPRSTKEIHSPSASVQMYPGKPNVQALIDGEIEGQVGTMACTVCGTGSLADDVRHAARSRMGVASIEFVENAFSW